MSTCLPTDSYVQLSRIGNSFYTVGIFKLDSALAYMLPVTSWGDKARMLDLMELYIRKNAFIYNEKI